MSEVRKLGAQDLQIGEGTVESPGGVTVQEIDARHIPVAYGTANDAVTGYSNIVFSVEDALSSWIDVRGYGAIGDGSTDDTAAIQAALDVVDTAGRGTVYLPTGTYKITEALTVPGEIKIYGDGWNRSRILTTHATDDIFSMTSVSRILITGFELYSNVTRTAGSAFAISGGGQVQIRDIRALATGHLMIASSATKIHMEDTHMLTNVTGGFNGGVKLTSVTSTDFDNVFITYGNETPYDPAFRIETGCDTISLRFSGNAPGGGGTGNMIGLRLLNSGAGTPPRWVKCVNCYFEGGTSADFANAEDGIVVTSGTSLGLVDTYVSGSKMGLRVTAGNGIRVIGGEYFRNGQHGIFINGGDDIHVIGAMVANNSAETAETYDGINIGADVDNFSLIGNTVGRVTNVGASAIKHRYDILVTAGTSNNYKIIGNTVKDGATATLLDNGTGTSKIVRFNIGYVTEASGTGSITSGGTTDVITHGLSKQPGVGDIHITFSENPTNDPGNWWISATSATTFTVSVRNDPGGSNLDFSWQASIY